MTDLPDPKAMSRALFAPGLSVSAACLLGEAEPFPD